MRLPGELSRGRERQRVDPSPQDIVRRLPASLEKFREHIRGHKVAAASRR